MQTHKIKNRKKGKPSGAGDVAQWMNTCLVCTRTWFHPQQCGIIIIIRITEAIWSVLMHFWTVWYACFIISQSVSVCGEREHICTNKLHIAAVCLDTASCIPCDFSPGDPGESGLHCVSRLLWMAFHTFQPAAILLFSVVRSPALLFAALPGPTLPGPQFLAFGYLHLLQFTELSPRMCVVEGG